LNQEGSSPLDGTSEVASIEVCPILCPPSFSNAVNTASSDG
jgi:hypothetical protein